MFDKGEGLSIHEHNAGTAELREAAGTYTCTITVDASVTCLSHQTLLCGFRNDESHHCIFK